MIAFSVGLSDSALDTASSTSSTDVTSPTLTSADCAIPSNHPTSTTLIAQSYALQQPPRTDIDAPFGADRAGTHPCRSACTVWAPLIAALCGQSGTSRGCIRIQRRFRAGQSRADARANAGSSLCWVAGWAGEVLLEELAGIVRRGGAS